MPEPRILQRQVQNYIIKIEVASTKKIETDIETKQENDLRG